MRWWSGVPWGWVLVSAYMTALVSAAVAQVTSTDTAINFIKDYQTLLAGVATVGALFIAVQQLRRQDKRDAVDAIRHYEAEIDAMEALDKAVRGLSSRSSMASRYTPPSDRVVWEEGRWERLQQEAHVSLSAGIGRLRTAVQVHNDLIPKPFGIGSVGLGFDSRLDDALRGIHYACNSLMSDIEQRRKIVLQLIRATS